MTVPTQQLLLFLTLTTLIFFFSRTSTQELFTIMYQTFRSKRAAFSMIAVIFFPGTVLHELAHFFMATILMLRVKEISVLPELYEAHIKLGKVIYEKRDVVSSVIVGVAPLILGTFLLSLFAYVDIVSHKSLITTLLIFYAIFVITATMFSSKQDLVDLLYMVPVIIIVGGVVYVFAIPVDAMLYSFFQKVEGTVRVVNKYLLYSLVLHVGLLLVCRSVRKFR